MRTSAFTATIIGLLVAMTAAAGPVAADEPGESNESAHLAREAIALIVNTPDNLEGIEEKITDALEATNQDDIDLDLVAEAEAAMQGEDLHGARALLERSVGAQPHCGNLDPLAIGETRGSPGMAMATGAETGTDTAIDPLPADRDRSAGDWLGLLGLAALAGAGLWLAARFRPRPDHHHATSQRGEVQP